jgi:hypothetical protein
MELIELMKDIQHLINIGIPVEFAPYVSLQHNVWVFEVWDCTPGPGEDDFICSYASHEEVIKAVAAYLYGEPTVIDGWMFPLHRHPELHREGIQYALAHAVNINQSDFEGIAERRRERIERYYWLRKRGTSSIWEKALQYQFLSIVHCTYPSILLRLRRDMQETYIVHLED